MADRSSARLFGEIFSHLAAEEGEVHLQPLVEWLWKKCQRYDFHPCQMEDAQEALLQLDLARKKVNSEYPEEYVIVYRGEVGFDSLPRYEAEGK